MDTIMDYVRWMGDLDFKQKPLCDLDVMVFCQIGYLDLKPVFAIQGGTPDVMNPAPGDRLASKEDQSETSEGKILNKVNYKVSPNRSLSVRTASRFIKAQGLVYNIRTVGPDSGQRELQDAIAASRRFGTIHIRDYVDEFDPETALQFSAMTFEVGDYRVISYCGTDHTIAGWKEDFMISFTHTLAQDKAVEYAERQAQLARRVGKKVIISGHSKGGNLALYAACLMSDADWETVSRVYVLDGPGLCPEVTDLSRVNRIQSKTIHYSPEYAIVSRMFPVEIKKKYIIKSAEEGLTQHALYSWGVAYGKPLLGEKHDAGSDDFEKIFTSWMRGLTQEERQHFVDQFFDALSNNGQAITLDDIGKNGVIKVEDILQNMKNMDKESKKVAKVLTSAVFENFVGKLEAAAQTVSGAVEAAVSEVIGEAEEAVAAVPAAVSSVSSKVSAAVNDAKAKAAAKIAKSEEKNE